MAIRTGGSVTLPAHLEAQAASVEAGLVHGAVLLNEAVAQVGILRRVQMPVGVVVDEPLGEVEQRPQLAEGAAVRLHLRGVVLRPEEGSSAVGGDVATFMDDVHQAGLQHLQAAEEKY